MVDLTLHQMIAEARKALHLHIDRELASFLGISRRTVQRHAYNGGVPPGDMHKLVRAVFPRNPALALSLGRALTIDLSDLAAAQPGLATKEPGREHVALVVLAACDALNLPPRDVRPALAAIFGQARSLGVDLDQLAKLLAEGAPAKAKPASKS